MTGADTLAALEKIGFTDRDCLPLRFSFEASSLRGAVDLAAELRAYPRGTVQLRPGALRLRGRCPWTVVLRTPSIPLTSAVISRREGEMQEIASRRAGCRFVGWTPVLDAVDVNGAIFRPERRPS